MIELLLENKNTLKYKDYKIRGDTITILGIGRKSIKYSINGREPEFAFYDSFEGRIIAKTMIKSFENEFWNKDIKNAIAAQKQVCKEHNYPMFAPEDGFCFSCGKQIYTKRSLEYAKTRHITGCPHCHRSYCD